MGRTPDTFDQAAFHNEVREWLETQDKQICVLFAARFALRAVPQLSALTTLRFSKGKSISDIILPLFWATGSTLSAGNWPDKAERAAANAATNVAHAANSVTNVATSAATHAATYATYTATSAFATNSGTSNHAAHATHAANAADAAYVAYDTYDANVAYAAAYADAYSAAFSEDKKWVESRSDDTPTTGLLLQPLWQRTVMPTNVSKDWQILKLALLKRDEDWSVWTNWYEDRRDGKPLNKELELAIINLDPEKYWNKGAAVTNAKIQELIDLYEPPKKPLQGLGPNFEYGPNDTLTKAPDNPNRDNDWPKLQARRPVLLGATEDLVRILNRGNVAHPVLLKLAQEYLDAISNDMRTLQFSTIAGIGIRLANAETAGKRKIDNLMNDRMEDDELEALTSVLDLHGPFILASDEGQIFLEDSSRWKRSQKENVELRRAALDIANKMIAENIVDDKAAKILADYAEEIGKGDKPERSAVFGFSTVKNAGIMVVNASIAVTIAGLIKSGIPPLMGGGALMGAVYWSAFKKTDTFSKWSGKVEDFGNWMEHLKEQEAIDILAESKPFKKMAQFVVDNEEQLRKIAGERREENWLHKQIDWVMRNYPKTKGDKGE